MIKASRVLAIVPARGGSKGVPRKNLRQVKGQPLLAFTINEAKKSKYIDKLILSSEDEEIIAVARSLGCEVPFVRPPTLASDSAPGIEPVLHALECLPGYDYVVLLQPTSPLRAVIDIDGCIERCDSTGAPSCVSITRTTESPYWMYLKESGDQIKPLISHVNYERRQDLPPVYVLNGAIYVAQPAWLMSTKSFVGAGTLGFEMPLERSLDIDTEDDLKLLGQYLERK